MCGAHCARVTYRGAQQNSNPLESAEGDVGVTLGGRKAVYSLGLEFVVVVVGILVALAVDDWRQARADRALEQHLLTSLIQDLEADSSDAALQDGASRRVFESAARLLAVIDSQIAGTSPQSSVQGLSQHLARLVFLAELEISDGTYAEMIATGSLRVLRDPDLRRQVSQYYSRGARILEIPRRQVDPRPALEAALAEAGVVPGSAGEVDNPQDLARRLASRPDIRVHIRRIRRYYARSSSTNAVSLLSESRAELLNRVRIELERFR